MIAQDRNDRAETAKRHDDSELTEDQDGQPSQSGAFGRNFSRDIGSRDEIDQAVRDGGVTRVRDGDEPEQANLPRFNESNCE